MRDLVNFKIKEQSDCSLKASFDIEASLPSFEGHFPGNPILPAVSIIDISLYLLENIKPEVSYNNIEVKRSKFMSMVQPNQTVEVLATTENGTDWRLLWVQEGSQEKLAQVHLVLPASITTSSTTL